MKNILQYALCFVGVAVILMFQSGYNPFAGSGEIGSVVTAAELHALKKSKESDGTRVAVVGHVTLPSMRLSMVAGRPVRLSVESPSNEPIDFLELYHGQGKNEFYVPAKFTKEDLTLYDNDNNTHAYNENVLISFTMTRIKEAQPEMNAKTGEYVWRYDHVRIDPATH